jgi:DNA-binding transcriptional LysR family regulator
LAAGAPRHCTVVSGRPSLTLVNVSTDPERAGGLPPGAGVSRPSRSVRFTGQARLDDIATVQLPNMERIRAFVVVAEELHFGRAAARLHLTQPPLSRQIMLLEQEVGVSLLDRGGRTVRLTPAGRVFLSEARRILRLAEESTLAVRRVPAGDGGTLAVGFTAVSVHGYVQGFLRRIGERLPHVDLVLSELVTAGQLEAIAAGDIDLGFVRPPVTRAGLLSRVVHTEQLLLAATAGDPLTRPGELADLAGLDGRAVVMYSPVESRYFYELLLEMFARAGARPRYVHYVSQVHTMLALVQAGLGLAVVPESAMGMHPGGVAFTDLAFGQSPPVELSAAWRADSDSPVLARALDLLHPL